MVADTAMTQHTHLSRRAVLQGAGALGASALLAPGASLAQAPAVAPRRIDVHHHFFPASWVKTLNALSTTKPLFGLHLITCNY